MAQPGDYTYRARRTLQQQPTLLERYGETHIHTMLRAYFPVFNPQTGLVRTNHDFGPLIEAAARTSAKIDLVEENEGFLDQVIFGLAYPKLCHEGVKDIAEDREMVILLLIRHFKKHGGLVLPPIAPSLSLQEKHVEVVKADIAARRMPSRMHYPNWRQAQTTAPPPGMGAPARGGGSIGRDGRGGGAAGPGGARGGLGGGN